MMTDRRFAIARRHSWLRAAYVHDDIVKTMLSSAGVTSDTNVADPSATGARQIDGPDATIGANLCVDVIPDTPVSRQAHLGRSGIDHEEQLITYAPKTADFLRSVFDVEGT